MTWPFRITFLLGGHWVLPDGGRCVKCDPQPHKAFEVKR